MTEELKPKAAAASDLVLCPVLVCRRPGFLSMKPFRGAPEPGLQTFFLDMRRRGTFTGSL